jgi:hypothetical protein
MSEFHDQKKKDQSQSWEKTSPWFFRFFVVISIFFLSLRHLSNHRNLRAIENNYHTTPSPTHLLTSSRDNHHKLLSSLQAFFVLLQ